MNTKIMMLALIVGTVLVLGCLGPGAEPTNETNQTQEIEGTLQETEEALNSATSELGDLNLSGFTVEEGL